MKTKKTINKMSCKRKVYGEKGIETIIVDNHSYAWSGSMPCTGVYRCVYCGQEKEKDCIKK